MNAGGWLAAMDGRLDLVGVMWLLLRDRRAAVRHGRVASFYLLRRLPATKTAESRTRREAPAAAYWTWEDKSVPERLSDGLFLERQIDCDKPNHHQRAVEKNMNRIGNDPVHFGQKRVRISKHHLISVY